MKDSIRAEVIKLVTEIGEIDDPTPFTDATHLYADLGFDSMQAMEVALELERRFGVTITEESMHQLATLGDAVQFVSASLARGNAKEQP